MGLTIKGLVKKTKMRNANYYLILYFMFATQEVLNANIFHQHRAVNINAYVPNFTVMDLCFSGQ